MSSPGNGYLLCWGRPCQLSLRISISTTQDFGFCWGVERSIALAYEAVAHFPGKTIHITNELIHNPEVNDNLANMNVKFIEKVGEGKKNFDTIGEGDVVILPAFGASFEEMDMLDKKVSFFILRSSCFQIHSFISHHGVEC